jgi:multiple sugar transport system substrate-binding protein
MRRLLLTTGVVLGLFFTGVQSASAAENACDGVTLKLLMEAVPDTDAVIALKGEFEQANGAQVEIEAINYSLMHEKLVPSLTASTGTYDVLVVDSYWVGEFKTAGWMEPLDELMAQANMNADVYIPSVMELNGRVDGTIYMLPFWHYIMGVLYRKDIVEDPAFQAAYKVQFGRDWRLPQSLDEMTEVAKWAKGQTGLYGFAMAGQRVDPVVMEMSNYLFSSGGDFYDRSTWQSTIDSAESVHAAEVYKDLLDNVAQPGALGANFDDVANTIKQGKAIFAVSYLFLWPYFQDEKESVVVNKMAFAPMPGDTPGLLGAWGWAIPSNAVNKDCSWQFLQWLESKDIAYRRAMLGGQAVQQWIYEDADFLKKWPQMEQAGQAIALSKGLPIMSRSTQLVEVYGEAMAKILTNEMTPEEGLAEAKEKMDMLTRNDPLLAH